MKWVFGKYRDNWADEMDVEGLFICTQACWDKIVTEATEAFKLGMFSYSIGTNEEIEYESLNDWLRAFEITEISEEKCSSLLDTFSNLGVGRSYDWMDYHKDGMLWQFGEVAICDFTEVNS